MSGKNAKKNRKTSKFVKGLEIFTSMEGWFYFKNLTADNTIKEFYDSLCSPDAEKAINSCLIESINNAVISEALYKEKINTSGSILKHKAHVGMKSDIRKYIKLAKFAIEQLTGKYPVILSCESNGLWGGRTATLRLVP